MVKANMASRLHQKDDDNSPLASLSRTLEALETRLARLTPASKTPPPSRDQPMAASTTLASEPVAAQPPRPTERRKPSLADAVSEIVMRRQMLDQTPPPAAMQPSAPSAPSAERRPDVRNAEPAGDAGLGQRFQALAGDVEALRHEGSNYSLMAEVAEELQRLRHEMKAENGSRNDPRFEAMRDSFDALRQMIETRQSPVAIGDGMSEITAALARLTEEGADRSTLNTLRAELEELRGLFGDVAKERTLAAVGERWEALEDRFSVHAERETESRTDLKNELERLRESLRSLASEDQVRAVEKRWDEFEDRYLGVTQMPQESAIPQQLRDELEGLRNKLEGMSEAASVYGDADRWGALEKRLDSREIEVSIQRLAERMADIETVLARLPQSLGIGPLEERIRSLGVGVDALSSRTEADLDQFVALEERLDEISRAIVATSLQPAPTLDMAPIERIEARIATLTARVDRIADEGDAEILSLRIGELSDRVEELAHNPAADALALRMNDLADRLETAFTELEQPRIDTEAIEQRLAALALRLEEAVQPKADNEMMRSLEAQIARLSDHLAHAGSLSDEFDSDFDRRLAAVEQRLEENREALIAAAREAADETARRMQAAGDRRQSEHVAQLSANLQSLEQLSRETDDRSNKVFEAVHSTLLKIVDRLEQIETDISRPGETEPADTDNALADRAAAHMAAASLGAAGDRIETPAPRNLRSAIARHIPGRQQETAATALVDRPTGLAEPTFDDRALEQVAPPSLDASDMLDRSEVNRPLEPGSGAPDIGALLERVRLQQRSKLEGTNEPLGEAETRAAARRAAQAAVAEAEALRAPADAGAEGKLSMTQRIARRRKTILMGVTAVLVALAALPVGKAFLSRDGAPATERLAIEGTALPETTQSLAPAPAVAAIAPAPAEMPATTTAQPAPLPVAEASARGTGSPSAAGLATAAFPADTAVKPTLVAMDGSEDVSVIRSRAEKKLPLSAAGPAPAIPATVGAPALKTAAESKDPKAQFEIGLRLLEGRGAEPNAAAALDWFAQAAKQGFAPAQYSLGTLYEKGNGIARDTGAARDWYLLAAEQGNIRAMHNLAVLYATGIEGKSDPETAAEWFERAAEHGMRDSQYNLGILYARGSGVDQSLVKSYKWFAIVAKSGDKDAEAKQKEVGEQLSPDQRAAADTEIAAWAPKDRTETANTVEVPQEWAEAKVERTASVDMKRAVRNIQAILGKLGYDAGLPDGVLGGKTTTAITAFQKDSGLGQTGKIDEPLIRALLARKNG